MENIHALEVVTDEIQNIWELEGITQYSKLLQITQCCFLSSIFTEVTDKIFLIYDRILYSLSCRSSYTHSSDSDSEDQEDETLKAIRVSEI